MKIQQRQSGNLNKVVNNIRKLVAQKNIDLKEAGELLSLDARNTERLLDMSKSGEFIDTIFEDAWLYKPQVFGDHRGFFMESYSKKKFNDFGIGSDFVQDNHSKSLEKGVLRGLHFQTPPKAQAKLVRATKGSVFDVIVDLRKDSETYGKWEGFYLTAENFLMLHIPKGFAHGFCTLEKDTEFQYKTDEFYSPENDSGIAWDDSTLAINWPIENPILSEKDKGQQNFKDFKSPFIKGL